MVVQIDLTTPQDTDVVDTSAFVSKQPANGDVLSTIKSAPHRAAPFVPAVRSETSQRLAILERSLRETDERLKLAVSAAKIGLWDWDLHERIVRWDNGMYRLFGQNEEQFTPSYDAFLGCVHADDRKHIDQTVGTAIQSPGLFDFDVRILWADGTTHYVQVTGEVFGNEDGTPQRMTGVCIDITERKSVERALQDSEQRLRLALKGAEAGVWDADLVKGTVWRSLRHDEIFGYDSLLPEWSFDIFLTHVLEEDRAEAQRVFDLGIATGQFNMECRILRVDNVVRWVSAKGETSCDEQGHPINMMGMVTDVTDRKQQEEQHRLMAVMQEREDFMATLTHDMQNPLIGANRLLELFVKGQLGVLTVEQCELLASLIESNSGVLNLISVLVDVYRLEKGATSLSYEDSDLIKLVTCSTNRISPFAKLRGTKVTMQLPQEMGRIRIDPTGLQRIMQNLLGNALKFTPPGGTIIVRLFALDDNAVIEVEDNGPGIKPEEQTHLFKRFSQGHAGKRYAGGSGLGLYLCKQIAEAHGGTIECKSQVNKVTTFRVCLPIRNEKKQCP
jgi:PAS domain S-box-containing protein